MMELDDIVDMKKFQELPQQSMINKFVPICKLLLINPATIAGEKVLFGNSKVKNMAPFNNG